ncbi:hypothetical protein D3C71_2173930 [compost metagenome]
MIGATVLLLLENKMGELGQWLMKLTSAEWFLNLGESVTMVSGLIFMICVLLFRRGIVGEVITWRERRRAGPSR